MIVAVGVVGAVGVTESWAAPTAALPVGVVEPATAGDATAPVEVRGGVPGVPGVPTTEGVSRVPVMVGVAVKTRMGVKLSVGEMVGGTSAAVGRDGSGELGRAIGGSVGATLGAEVTVMVNAGNSVGLDVGI